MEIEMEKKNKKKNWTGLDRSRPSRNGRARASPGPAVHVESIFGAACFLNPPGPRTAAATSPPRAATLAASVGPRVSSAGAGSVVIQASRPPPAASARSRRARASRCDTASMSDIAGRRPTR
jgi:hypothetical protein